MPLPAPQAQNADLEALIREETDEASRMSSMIQRGREQHELDRRQLERAIADMRVRDRGAPRQAQQPSTATGSAARAPMVADRQLLSNLIQVTLRPVTVRRVEETRPPPSSCPATLMPQASPLWN